MARPRTTSDAAILEATARAIGLHGTGGLTLAVVAKEAGLSPATLVQRFGSKRGLLLALAEQSARTVRGRFDRAREAHESPLAALHAAMAGLASDVTTPRELANSLGFLQLDLTDPEFRQHAADATRRMQQGVAGLLGEAASAGELVPGVDIGRLARAVMVAYNGALILWALTGEGSLDDALRADLDELLRPHRSTRS